MRFVYDIEKIQKLLRAVSELTGISMAFLNPENRFLCSTAKEHDFCSRLQCVEENRAKCACSDHKILQASFVSGMYESHICYAGLYDAAIPMIKNGMLAGSVIMGRIRASDSPVVPSVTCDKELRELYAQIPKFTDVQLDSLRILLPNILFASAIKIEHDPVLEEVVSYIGENLCADLSLTELCTRFHVSKNILYQSFRDHYNCTVNAYVTDQRIELAKKLLQAGDAPVYLIAEQTGLGCDTYFSKIFKKKTGMTPKEFRKAAGKW